MVCRIGYNAGLRRSLQRPKKKPAEGFMMAENARAYKKYGAEKDRCFKESSGFDGTGLSNESQESLKNYAILLLYDLQERIEEKYENGEISSKEASLLIENIVRMKKVLLQGGSGEQVRGMLSSFKQKW